MAPPQGQTRPSRYLAVLALIFVALYAAVFFGGPDKVADKFKPKLGLDLVGGTTLTLIATTENGRAPDGGSLEQARQIIANRVDGLGVAEAQVVTEGDRNIVISLAGEKNDTIRQVGKPAQLRFRKVISTTNDSPVAPAPSSSSTATPGATASATPAASPTTAPATTAPTTAPSASPSASAAPDKSQLLAEVLKKLGAAATAAAQIQSPTEVASNPGLSAQLEPFRKLTPEEVAVLDPTMQFVVPQITCDVLNRRPPGSLDAMDKPAVSCEEGGNLKYLLDVAKVAGTDVAKANAGIDSSAGAKWVVNLSFTSPGQKRWTALTQEAFSNTDSKCLPDGIGPDQHCRVAVVLDNQVVSAPEVQDVQPGDSQISGSFTKDSAQLLASQLRYGALPLTFTQGDATSISATLGTQQLKAGLLAAGIGMLLVIVYAFFYYRLLGIVIFLSLALSGLLTFGMLVLLGRSIGFTLTLAGIAGFIVSLGVAADSFVIYFERLKDEIREGRGPRSAIPRAWARARRTIITANAVTFLAALFLYLVGVGSVRGFAFAMGLATVLDLVIVFLFRHPIMTLLAGTPAFLSPRVSGLGRVLQHAGVDTPATGAKRTKEA
ncbi:MAG: protein translocase subunit SecD [Micromonosporaceae bacterium]